MALLKDGLNVEEVAAVVESSTSSVCRWKQMLAAGGRAALSAKPIPGRPRKLQEADFLRLLGVLLKGALAYGYPNDLWTLKRIAQMIRREFGVAYHPNHVWRLLRRCGWSCQVPERRAVQRDDEAIAHWRQYRWPHIKKRPKTWGPSGLPG
jgi:transposase